MYLSVFVLKERTDVFIAEYDLKYFQENAHCTKRALPQQSMLSVSIDLQHRLAGVI